jgi:hypothetical protein
VATQALAEGRGCRHRTTPPSVAHQPPSTPVAAAATAAVSLRLASGMPGLLGLCFCLAGAAMAAYPTPSAPRVLVSEKPGRRPLNIILIANLTLFDEGFLWFRNFHFVVIELKKNGALK